jgi:hypothetical protein
MVSRNSQSSMNMWGWILRLNVDVSRKDHAEEDGEEKNRELLGNVSYKTA